MSNEKAIKREIYRTTDYGRFRRLPGNRPLDNIDTKNHIKQLAKSMEKHPYLLEYAPLWVRSDMSVIDGQNRLEAAKLNKQPVYYVFVDDLDIADVHVINTHVKKWTIEDFARSYAELGKVPYQNLVKIIDMGFRCTIAINLFYPIATTVGSNVREAFKKGNFNPPVSFAEATRRAEKLQELSELNPMFKTLNVMAGAWVQIQLSNEYDHDRFKEKLVMYQNARKIERPASREQALRALEEIYNWKQINKTRLY